MVLQLNLVTSKVTDDLDKKAILDLKLWANQRRFCVTPALTTIPPM